MGLSGLARPALGDVEINMAIDLTRNGLRAVAISLLSATALTAASPAAAAYSVNVQATASAGTIYDAGSEGCRYNYSGTGGICNGGTAHYGGSAGGTVTPLGGDNSATKASASVGTGGGGASATASATSDLSTASLHLTGIDSGQIQDVSSGTQPHGYTGAYAAFTDVLHFAVAGANANTVTPFTLIFGLDGNMRPTGSSSDGNSNGEIFGQLNFGGSDARFDLKNNASTGFQTVVNYLDTYPSGAPGVWTTNADHSVNTYTQTINIVGASKDFAVSLFANLNCATGMTCDYGNTAKIGLQLPSGVTFTSDSGVFLAGLIPVPGGVPEPATWAMMLVGIGGVGAAMRRTKARSAASYA